MEFALVGIYAALIQMLFCKVRMKKWQLQTVNYLKNPQSDIKI